MKNAFICIFLSLGVLSEAFASHRLLALIPHVLKIHRENVMAMMRISGGKKIRRGEGPLRSDLWSPSRIEKIVRLKSGVYRASFIQDEGMRSPIKTIKFDISEDLESELRLASIAPRDIIEAFTRRQNPASFGPGAFALRVDSAEDTVHVFQVLIDKKDRSKILVKLVEKLELPKGKDLFGRETLKFQSDVAKDEFFHRVDNLLGGSLPKVPIYLVNDII